MLKSATENFIQSLISSKNPKNIITHLRFLKTFKNIRASCQTFVKMVGSITVQRQCFFTFSTSESCEIVNGSWVKFQLVIVITNNNLKIY